jgi:signal transduction protein with GAF and PtsI domain
LSGKKMGVAVVKEKEGRRLQEEEGRRLSSSAIVLARVSAGEEVTRVGEKG